MTRKTWELVKMAREKTGASEKDLMGLTGCKRLDVARWFVDPDKSSHRSPPPDAIITIAEIIYKNPIDS